MIYLDNAATTFPKPPIVLNAMDECNRCSAVNAGRGSYHAAREASLIISETKDLIRKLVHVDSGVPVVFTPSITIALNQVIGGIEWIDNSVIYVSPYEHNAVVRTLYGISKYKNIIIKQLPLNQETLEIDLDKMKYEFSKDKPNAVFCTHISNVTGYVLPIDEIFDEAKKYECVTILDTAQSLGLIDIRADIIKADIVAFTGHKSLYGPIGIGGFINVAGIEINEYLFGGTGSDSLNLSMPNGSETRYEMSSVNIVAITGLKVALENLDIESAYETEKELSEYLINNLQKNKRVKIYLPQNLNCHIGVVSFVVAGYKSDDVGMILDEDFDIAVRTGYHCAPFIHYYLKDESSNGTIRIGLGKFNTKEDIDKVVKAIEEL